MGSEETDGVGTKQCVREVGAQGYVKVNSMEQIDPSIVV
jgi:hypothetical protein